MCGSVFPVSVCAGGEREIEREGGRESKTGTEDWMYECGSVCWRETHENGDKDKGRDSGGGATNGGELSRALRVSVSQSELWSQISWFFTGSAAHYLGGERGERVGEGWGVGRRRGSAFNLTRLICLPHLSGFYSLLLARPLSNLFGQANTHDARRRPEGRSAERQENGKGRRFFLSSSLLRSNFGVCHFSALKQSFPGRVLAFLSRFQIGCMFVLCWSVSQIMKQCWNQFLRTPSTQK